MKQINTKQLCILLVMGAVAYKLLYLPSLLTKYFAQDSWLIALIYMLVDVGILSIFLFLSKRNPDLTFKQMLNQMFGKIIATIICVSYFFVFILRSIAIFQSQYKFLIETLYQEFPWITFTLIMVAVVWWVCKHSLRTIARLFETLFALIVFALVTVLFIGIINTDITDIMPIFANMNNIGAIFKFPLWFGDFTLIVIMLGNIKKEKHFYKRVYIYCSAAILYIVSFIIVFHSAYGYSAPMQKKAISDILEAYSFSSDFGRVGWIIVLIWMLSLYLSFILSIFCASKSIDMIFEKSKKNIGIYVSIPCIIASIIVTNFDISRVIYYVSSILNYGVFAVQVIFPIIFLIFSFKIQKFKEVNNSNTKSEFNRDYKKLKKEVAYDKLYFKK